MRRADHVQGMRRKWIYGFGVFGWCLVYLLFVRESNGQERIRHELLRVIATAYCPCERCCAGTADGRTAIGRDASRKGVAVDPAVIPLRSRIDVPGYGTWILADDTGGAIIGRRIDLRMATHDQAIAYGRKEITIRVWRTK